MATQKWFNFDYQEFSRFCDEAADYYEKSAPQVVTWLDQVLERAKRGTLTLKETAQVVYLCEGETWLDAHGAGNLAYKVMREMGTLPSNVTLAF